MSWPQTVNGVEYTESDFARYGYITAFPAVLADIIAHVANSLTGTSSSSIAVGTGSKSLTASTGRSWIVGQPVRVARTSAPTTTYMDGTVTAYSSSSGAMTVNVTATGGSGTHTDWSISVTGTAGGGGGFTGPGSSTDNAVVRFDGAGGSTVQNSGVIISDANAVTGVASLTLASGATVTEFSTDDTMVGDSDSAVPTEQAVKAYVDGYRATARFAKGSETASSTAEITWLTKTVPANTLGTTGIVHLRFHGRMLNNDGADRTYTVRVKWGGTEIFNDTLTWTTDADYGGVEFDLWIQADGATNAQNVFGTGIHCRGQNINTWRLPSAANVMELALLDYQTTIDTTANADIVITCQNTTSSANVRNQFMGGYYEVIK
jgi:hypothetical protein